MDQYAEAYRRETYEYLEDLETALLDLESDTDNIELVNQVFRIFHTIKGSGSMFGFDDIADFTHQIETIYDCVRNGELAVTKKLVDITLLACDMIKKMVDGLKLNTAERMEITKQFSEMLPQAAPLEEKAETSKENEYISTDPVTYRIRFAPHEDLFKTGTNPLLLFDELRTIGECTIVANIDNIPCLRDLSPESCYLLWDIILTTDQDINNIKDVFIFVEDKCELSIKSIEDNSFFLKEDAHKKLGEILLERDALSPEDLMEALNSQKRLGEVLVNNNKVKPNDVLSALKEQEHFANLQKKHRENVAASSVRVPTERLDALVDLVGELVTVQARLSEEVSAFKRTNLSYISEEIERLTGELRDKTMNIRMLPIDTLFTRFKRVVRDLSQELGKKVQFQTDGGENELDKRVIEQLNDPLVHLIRNSIDHGIEPPEYRKSAGKSTEGRLSLKALHSGDNVLITIEDDGAGLNPEKIRMKAIERGLISADAQLPQEDLFMLIFSPGFSTAAKVTGVSGRGVGMDVVKKSLEALQGSVSVTSKINVGTKITLKVPLTLAIVDGLMVKAGEGDYVFPLSTVEECVELPRQEAERAQKRKMMELRGRMVRYMNLCDYFDMEKSETPFEKIVIIDSHGKKIGIGVDAVVGKLQTVIKSIGDVYKDVNGLSGATIKGDGTIALVLDVNTLSKAVGENREMEAF